MMYRLPLDPPSLGEKLLVKMTRLKIDMLRHADEAGDRNILCDFEISGHLRPETEDGEDAAVLRALLSEFISGSGGPETETEGGACNG